MKREGGKRQFYGAIWAAATMGVAGALFFGASALVDVSPFKLGKIELSGNTRTPPEHVMRIAGLVEGESIFKRDIDDVGEDIAKLPWVRGAKVTRRLPSTLYIAVEEYQPAYLISLAGRLYYFSADGKVIEAPLGGGLDFPVITGFSWSSLEGDKQKRGELMELLGKVSEENFGGRVEEIHFDAEDGFFVTGDFPFCSRIRFGRGELDRKLDLLTRLRKTLERRGEFAKTADLTYDDRIVARLEPSVRERGKQ
ncbi:MAG: hypothetical protein C0608_11700 [Deltaproteobacteria bacterium]|mgnify:FL=1|nr:MAG: hypothetical protein C0608_11700 [Deltaproteobacteria bacterium]